MNKKLARERSIKIYIDIAKEKLRNSILITGFRGYGLVGYLVSRYVALALKARRIGYILTRNVPPGIVIENNEVGFPFDIYFSEENKLLMLVNRALPERREWDAYTESIARLSSNIGIRYAILVGGLSRDFRMESEKYGYRWIANEFFRERTPEAPKMEEGLGIMGPLALLYIYMTYHKVPALVILPYSSIEEADYNATMKGVEVISKVTGVKIDLTILKKAIEAQKVIMERMAEMVEESTRKEGEKSFYM